MKYSHAKIMPMAGPEKPVGAKMLAEKLNVSRTYLSEMMAQLVKAELIQSVSGLNGGYRLRKPCRDISFLDIIHGADAEPKELKIRSKGRIIDSSEPLGIRAIIQPITSVTMTTFRSLSGIPLKS